MIRIRKRQAEPEVLRAVREGELGRLRALRRSRGGRLTGTDFGSLYKDAMVAEGQDLRFVLWSEQAKKCCYCERIEPDSRRDVEHYRPKTSARRGEEWPDNEGYWWLAWTWSNLMFSCDICNRDGKNDAFPLMPGSAVLAHGEEPPGAERPMLIHPCEENPMRHIQFVHDDTPPNHKWWARPRGRSKRGAMTIQALDLNRSYLLEVYQQHVEMCLQNSVRLIRSAIQSRNPGRIQREWEEQCRALLRWRRPLAALSHDVLDHFFNANVRARWGLKLRIRHDD